MRIAIIGRSELLYETTRCLLVEGHEITCIITAKEAPEYTRTADDYHKLALELNIPFACGSKIRNFSGFLRETKSDIAVSINYSGIVPQDIIDIFPMGVLNAHGGDLPRYRGNACQAWAILNGEKHVGLCIHKMVGGELDSGDIVAREYHSVDNDTNITKIWNWMADTTPRLISEALERLLHDPNFVLERQSKEPRDALRCYPRRPEDGCIDWEESSLSILRLINASSSPYAGAYCDLNGEKLIVWSAQLITDDENYCAVPGQVINIGDSWVDVACGKGKLRIKQVSVGKEKQFPTTLIKSIRIRLK